MADVLLLADPFDLLDAEPISRFGMVLPIEGVRVNLGFVYVRGSAVRPGGGVSSVLWDVVRRLRLFTEEETLVDARGTPQLQGLWDQGLFTDALSSAAQESTCLPSRQGPPAVGRRFAH